MKQKQSFESVLISPLNWGLGHATRIIPIIRSLLAEGKTVTVAAESKQLILLKTEFPDIQFIKLHNCDIRYSNSSFQFLTIFMQIPIFVQNIRREHRALTEILSQNSFNLIISDNRYGFYSKKIRSVFITHQISPLLPHRLAFLQFMVTALHKVFIHKFDLCLIPDFEFDRNLSGKLSHVKNMPKRHKFIGILSRFSSPTERLEPKLDLLFILSGPEPQRSIFEEIIRKEIAGDTRKITVIVGRPDAVFAKRTGNTNFLSHTDAQNLQKLILSAKYVITRAGYSSVMDLVSLQKKAVLVPTPGQSEQEYLGDYLSKKGLFVKANQKNFNLKTAIEMLDNLNPDFSAFSNLEAEKLVEYFE